MEINLGAFGTKPGIYKIINTQNGRAYYGSSYRLKQRAFEHKKALEKNKHGNSFLQHDFNKCGTVAFEFHVIEAFETNDKTVRLAAEQLLIDKYHDGGKQCYNIRKEANSREGCKPKNPIEFAKAASTKAKAMWADPTKREEMLAAQKAVTSSVEHRVMLSEAGLKAWDGNEDRRTKAVASHVSRWKIMDGERKEAIVAKSINSAAAKQNRKQTLRHRLETDPEFAEMYRQKGLKSVAKINANVVGKIYPGVISPDGTVYEQIVNLRRFAREHGLFPDGLRKILTGKYIHCKGWKLHDPKGLVPILYKTRMHA
jgi:group I intron endonuclease